MRWRDHARITSQHTILTTRLRRSEFEQDQLDFSDDENDGPVGMDELEEEGAEEEEDSDASSISESSIIDLPPPLTLGRIIPPTSLSISTNLNLSLTEDSPVLGPLVRRTKSARLLARSWGRDSPGKKKDSTGYGTFGFGARADQSAAESSAFRDP